MVYRARNTKLNRDVALKMLLPEIAPTLNRIHDGDAPEACILQRKELT